MTTPFFRTTSNEVQVTDAKAVENILNDYELRPQEVDSIFNGNTISIRTPEMPNFGFYVNRIADGQEDTTVEMYDRLAKYLEEPLPYNSQRRSRPMNHGNYVTEIDCDVCPETFSVRFNDPSVMFSGTCPHCETHYPELSV